MVPPLCSQIWRGLCLATIYSHQAPGTFPPPNLKYVVLRRYHVQLPNRAKKYKTTVPLGFVLALGFSHYLLDILSLTPRRTGQRNGHAANMLGQSYSAHSSSSLLPSNVDVAPNASASQSHSHRNPLWHLWPEPLLSAHYRQRNARGIYFVSSGYHHKLHEKPPWHPDPLSPTLESHLSYG